MATKCVEHTVCDVCGSETKVKHYLLERTGQRAQVDLCPQHDTMNNWFKGENLVRRGAKRRKVLTVAEVERLRH